MTKDQILERVSLLMKEREGVKLTLSAYDGAIQDCQYWLKRLEEENVQSHTEQSDQPV